MLVVDGTGHWETLGTAELLALRGAAVEVICARPLIGSSCDTAGRVLWHRRAIEHGIVVSPNVELVEVVPDGALVRDLLLGSTRTIAADVVVPVVARRSREDLYLQLVAARGDEIDLLRVGDCVAPRLLQHAIGDGEAAGRTVTAARSHTPSRHARRRRSSFVGINRGLRFRIPAGSSASAYGLLLKSCPPEAYPASSRHRSEAAQSHSTPPSQRCRPPGPKAPQRPLPPRLGASPKDTSRSRRVSEPA